jgi:hypothetical protein
MMPSALEFQDGFQLPVSGFWFPVSGFWKKTF